MATDVACCGVVAGVAAVAAAGCRASLEAEEEVRSEIGEVVPAEREEEDRARTRTGR
jgi:hypothetical protein